MKGKWMEYSDDVKEYIINNQYGITRKQLTKQINEKFGTEYSVDNIHAYCVRNKLRNGNNGQFQKGQASHNKGQKMSNEVYDKIKETMFKKGNVPENHRTVGSERVNVDGYIEVKVSEPNKWRLKHNVIWEQYNGPIPKGYVVLFLDRNQLNVDISNLKLITRRELLVLNRYKLITDDVDINNTATILAKLIDTNRIVKRRKHENG